MKRFLLAAILAVLPFAAYAQALPGPIVVPMGTLDSGVYAGLHIDGTGALKTTATVASGTFSDTLTAIAALPTLAPGTQTPRGSLAGAYYVQPVFGSTSGGGTQVDLTHGLPVQGSVSLTSLFPANATAITASATGTTAATTATLANVGGKTTYICGFTISAKATSATSGAATVTGTVTGTLNYIQNVGTATVASTLSQTFAPCVPASGANIAIAVQSVAAGSGGNTAVTAWGYQL